MDADRYLTEVPSDLVQPHVILPLQHFEPHGEFAPEPPAHDGRRGANVKRNRGGGSRFIDALPEDGERRLMLGVLIDAIHVLAAHRPPSLQIRLQRAWFRERAWIQSEDKAELFSFANICDTLGLDASYVRCRVLRPPDTQHPHRVRRYPERVKETWARLQRRNAQGAKAILPGHAAGARSRATVFAQGVG